MFIGENHSNIRNRHKGRTNLSYEEETLELVFTTFALFIVTMVASFIFYQRIKMAQTEYEDSKDVVRTITFGFTRQVKKIEDNLNKIEKGTLEARYLADQAMNLSQGSNESTLKGLEAVKGLSNRVVKLEDSIDTMKQALKKLATQPRRVVQRAEVDAPIPVQGEDVLQQITETELEVLMMIVDLAEGTVPEIREKINKTREHTARLLKKLYNEGFIDRNTSRMPYRYSIRKEIRDLILERQEQTTLSL